MRVSVVLLMAPWGLSGCAHIPRGVPIQRQTDTFKAGIGLVDHTDCYIYTMSPIKRAPASLPCVVCRCRPRGARV